MEWLCKYGLDAHGSPNTRGEERERDELYVVCTKNSFEIEPRWFHCIQAQFNHLFSPY